MFIIKFAVISCGYFPMSLSGIGVKTMEIHFGVVEIFFLILIIYLNTPVLS